MNHGWNKKKLGELTDFKYGYPFDSKKFNMDCNGMPLIRIRDVVPGRTSTYYDGEFSDEYIIKSGDYLIGMDGEFNIARWNSYEALLNQRVCKVMSADNNVMLNQFLYFFLKIELKRIEEYTPFVTVKHLSAKTLNNIIIPIPPLNIQNKLVSELDKINELIGVKRSQLKDLDALAQSLFYETFGDPIDNPKGWEMKQLYEECIDIVDGDHLAPPKSNEGIPFITISNIDKSRNCIDFTDSFFVPQNYFEGLKENRKPRKGDVLYTVTGSYGITVLIKDKTRFCFQRHIGLIRPKETLNSVFLMYWGRTSSIKHHADSVATGIAQKTVSLKALRTFPLFLPPLALQEQFAERIEAIEEQKKLVEASIADLETLLASRMDYWFND